MFEFLVHNQKYRSMIFKKIIIFGYSHIWLNLVRDDLQNFYIF